MTTTTGSRPDVRVRYEPSSRSSSVIVGQQTAIASGLTVLTLGLGAAIAATLGSTALLMFGLTLPVPLLLLWLSADVVRSDESDEGVAER